MKKLGLALIVGAAMTVAASASKAATITVDATALCQIRYWVENWGAPWLTDAGVQDSNGSASTFWKFASVDLGSLGTINSATLTVIGDNGNSSFPDDPYGASFRMLDGVTANVYATTNNWDSANGYSPYVTASPTAYSLTGVAGTYYATADVTAILSDAIAFGLRINDPDGGWEAGLWHAYKTGAYAVANGGAYDLPATALLNTSITIDYTLVPEPTSLGVGGIAAVGMLLRRRHRKA